MIVDDILRRAIEKNASDLHMTVGIPATVRINGELIHMDDKILTPDDTKDFVRGITSDAQWITLNKKGEVDFSYALVGLKRFRINAFRQRNAFGAALRLVNTEVPSYKELGLPNVIMDLTNKKNGIILVTGPTGSGKSTTLASMIDKINETMDRHIITLEDPIEYLFKHKKSIVNQREVGSDTLSFANALRASLRQDPDVILVGEMRDYETISVALTAAETGHLVLSTLHTIGASKTIDRIIDVFPPSQQDQIRVQLAMTLQAVVSQQLLMTADKSRRVPAVEVMISNQAIKNNIREGKTHQLNNIIQTSAQQGMVTMDDSLIELYKKGDISRESVLDHCVDLDNIKKSLF